MISEDIVLMFDEMYLQKCEEYCGGEIIGANENNELRITRIYDHRIKRICPLNYQICSRAKHDGKLRANFRLFENFEKLF